MFGSDAGAPVFYWIAAENSRRALYIALSNLVDMKRFDEGKAISIAKKIMRDNAIRIHDLDLDGIRMESPTDISGGDGD